VNGETERTSFEKSRGNAFPLRLVSKFQGSFQIYQFLPLRLSVVESAERGSLSSTTEFPDLRSSPSLLPSNLPSLQTHFSSRNCCQSYLEYDRTMHNVVTSVHPADTRISTLQSFESSNRKLSTDISLLLNQQQEADWGGRRRNRRDVVEPSRLRS